jgi:hypothetical protein
MIKSKAAQLLEQKGPGGYKFIGRLPAEAQLVKGIGVGGVVNVILTAEQTTDLDSQFAGMARVVRGALQAGVDLLALHARTEGDIELFTPTFMASRA